MVVTLKITLVLGGRIHHSVVVHTTLCDQGDYMLYVLYIFVCFVHF